MIRIEEQNNKCIAHIEGEMTIYNATELMEEMMPAIKDQRELEFNLANVAEIDSAGIQLLMLAKQERTAKEHSLALTNYSAAVSDAFDLMDMASYFNDVVAKSGEKGDNRGA